MTFTGLCAFVPKTPATGQPIVEGTVLLVNATPPVEDLNFHSPLSPHAPILRYMSDTMKLQGKELAIDATDAKPYPLSLVTGLVSNPQEPNKRSDEDRDTFWITRMEDLGVTGVSDHCFDTLLGNGIVAARIKLNAGYLSTSELIRNSDTGEITTLIFYTGFDSISPKLTRAMAAEFTLRLQVPGDHMNLLVTENGQTTPILLRPVGEEVSVHIENLCGKDCSPHEKGSPSFDFAWFYRIAKERSPILLPYPKDGGGLTDTYCPPAMFPAHPKA